jgi:iron complex outermembrane receptor protein
LDISASLFYYSYENYQIFTATQFLGGNPEFVILNANDAEVYGSEVEAVARPWEGGVLDFRFAWLQSQFLDFVKRDQFLSTHGGQDLINFRETQYAGNPLLNSPKFKVSMTADQRFNLGRYGSIGFRYDVVWTDTTYFDPTKGGGLGNLQGEQFLPDDTIAQPAYWLHGIRVSWRDSDELIEVAGWVRNIANTPYKAFAFDGSSFRTTTIYFVGDPRTYGVSLNFGF